ncbi:uncharacterized protein C8Q71DRAFT_29244 [Rhodofomes roseus]|uniref:Long chronological lifespan protein 2 n=1 Tax=Rhodofomes roseus TaxID=34475 RepID=A0ABQ8KXP8_9APHY|nr:uncharacterized protein C8Q71DRAFT_29244 [Rhodofomes roseus]KAH9844083.1 hypothetical protein C8Q71DRAFT_29244 [Rhodofomes roseus]
MHNNFYDMYALLCFIHRTLSCMCFGNTEQVLYDVSRPDATKPKNTSSDHTTTQSHRHYALAGHSRGLDIRSTCYINSFCCTRSHPWSYRVGHSFNSSSTCSVNPCISSRGPRDLLARDSGWHTRNSVPCSQYLCPNSLICVSNPADCPCPDLEDIKCVVPDAKAKQRGTVVCTRGASDCKQVERLASKLA